MSATNEPPKPHFFLIESDLSGLEELRKLVGSERRTAHWAIEQLRGRLDDDDARPYADMVASCIDSLHRLLVAALDARTAELTDEATGYGAERTH